MIAAIFLSWVLPFDLLPDPAKNAPPLKPPPASYRAGFDSVSERTLRAWLGFLASDELEGREAGTRGYDTAARYVASVLYDLSVLPLGAEGTYFQDFDLVRRERDVEKAEMALRAAGKDGSVLRLEGQVAVKVEGDPANEGDILWTLPWVFAGHGESAAEDAPDDFRGIDVKDRVVLVLPPTGKTSREDRGALLAGARRIAVVSDERVKSKIGLSFPEQPGDALRKGQPGGARPNPEDPAARTVFISRETADKLLAGRGTSVEKLLEGPGRPRPFALDGLEVRLELKVKETRRPTRNVVGLLEGSDPVLKQEIVAIGAHLDHVGSRDGKVYYGADDDGSGVCAVLGAARAFAANGLRPRRSILFLFFAAEEKGLLGSRYFAEHPPVPLDRIVCELQLDMVGRNEEVRSSDPKLVEKPDDNLDSLHVVGSKRHSVELDPWLNSVNELVGMRFEYDEERVYERSDQYNFGSRGIPVAFLFAGFHPDYHQPTDSAEKINFAKLASVTRLVFSLAFEVADRARRLPVNRF